MLHSDVIALLQINCCQRCREQGITARWAKEEGAPGWTSGSKMGRASQLQIIELLEVWSSARPSESWHGEAPEHLSLSNNRGHNARASQATNISKSRALQRRKKNEKNYNNSRPGLPLTSLAGQSWSTWTLPEAKATRPLRLERSRKGFSRNGFRL